LKCKNTNNLHRMGIFPVRDISRSGIFPDQGFVKIGDIFRLGVFPDWGYF